MILDSHHHLWSYNDDEYGWIPEGSPCRADFLLPELEEATRTSGVDGTVAVQARQKIEESDALIAMGERSDVLKGIVGWVPLIDDAVAGELDRLAPIEKFKGVRHVLQDEPDEYFLRDDFHRGLSLLPSYDLRYDLLLFQRQLPVALQLVDRQPELGIIVDHIAKPEIHNGRIEADWRTGMKQLAARDNVLGVKVSGMVNEVVDEQIDEATLKNYFLETLEMFGADRVMFGTDWPVCLMRIDAYKVWADMVKGWVSDLSADEQAAILGGNCAKAYQI